MCKKYKKTIEKVLDDLGLSIIDYKITKHQKFTVMYNGQGPYHFTFAGSPSNGCADKPVYIKKSIKQQTMLPDEIKEQIFGKKEKEQKVVRKKLKLSKKPVNAVKPERVLTPEENIKLGYARLKAYRESLKKKA